MSAGLLSRPHQTFLSEQIYGDLNCETGTSHRYPVGSIAVDASQPLSVPFGNEGWFKFSDQPPKWFFPLLFQISELGNLSFNWNSYGALPVNPETALSALTLLLRVLTPSDPNPTVVPTSRGGVLIEWHDCGIDLEVELKSPTSIDVLFDDGSGEEEIENADLGIVEAKLQILRGRL